MMGSNRQQCAPCKYQGRPCDEHCKLAPYFPISCYDEYVHAHRLFGIAKIKKITNMAGPNEKQVAAESMLFEGCAWAVDPVHGCTRIIRRLLEEIVHCEKELEIMNEQLRDFRQRDKGKRQIDVHQQSSQVK